MYTHLATRVSFVFRLCENWKRLAKERASKTVTIRHQDYTTRLNATQAPRRRVRNVFPIFGLCPGNGFVGFRNNYRFANAVPDIPYPNCFGRFEHRARPHRPVQRIDMLGARLRLGRRADQYRVGELKVPVAHVCLGVFARR